MTPKEQTRLYHKEYSDELYKIAIGDLESAKVIAKSKKGRVENIFFLVQQSIEKALKSLLVHNGVPVPLTHNLGVLVAKIPDHLELPFGYELSSLNDFAGIRRYEQGEYTFTTEEIQDALETAEKIIQFCKNHFKK